MAVALAVIGFLLAGICGGCGGNEGEDYEFLGCLVEGVEGAVDAELYFGEVGFSEGGVVALELEGDLGEKLLGGMLVGVLLRGRWLDEPRV